VPGVAQRTVLELGRPRKTMACPTWRQAASGSIGWGLRRPP